MLSEYHYYHNRVTGTVAAQCPEKWQILEGVAAHLKSQPVQYKISYGKAMLSDGDQFNKSTGREISRSRVADKLFDISAVTVSGKVVKVMLMSEDKSMLRFSVHLDKERTFFVYAN